MRFKFFFLIVFIAFGFQSFSQNHEAIKILKQDYKDANTAFKKASIQCKLAEEYENFNSDTSFHHANIAFAFFTNNSNKQDTLNIWKEILYKAKFFIACYHGVHRHTEEMFSNYRSAFSLAKKAKDLKYISKTGTNLGIELIIAESVNGQSCITEAYQAAIKSGDKKLIINAQAGLAYFYTQLGEYQKSIDYLRKNEKYLNDVEVDFSKLTYISIAKSFIHLKKPDSAIFYLNKTLLKYQKLHLEDYTASLLTFLGRAYIDLNQNTKAITILQKSITLFNKHKNIVWPETYQFIGEAYYNVSKFDSSIFYYKKSVEVSNKVNNQRCLYEGYYSLSMAYKSNGNTKDAITAFKDHLALTQSIAIITKKNQLLRNVLIFDHQNKSYTDSIKRLESSKIHDLKLVKLQAINKSNTNNKRTIYISLLLLSLIVIYLTYNTNKINKINTLIVEQRNKVEDQLKTSQIQTQLLLQQKKEIDESIRYSERIVNNILPYHHFIENNKEKAFIFHTSPEVISSDFYFFANKKEFKFIALFKTDYVGIPGIMLNLLINYQLNSIVNNSKDGNISVIFEDLLARIKTSFTHTDANADFNLTLGILCINKHNNVTFLGHNIDLLVLDKGGEKLCSGIEAHHFSRTTTISPVEHSIGGDTILILSNSKFESNHEKTALYQTILNASPSGDNFNSKFNSIKINIDHYLAEKVNEENCIIGLQV